MDLQKLERCMREDFTVFADVIFRTTLQLGPLTRLQKDFCKVLQYDENPRLFLSCFRGFGKSYLLALFSIWLLFNDPDEKIIVVSASAPRSKDFVRFSKDVIKKTPILRHLIDTTNQNRKHRTSVYSFDIIGSKPSQFASLKAVGIGGQITGARATRVIFDDVEISTNSTTEAARIKLTEGMKEANALLLPGGKIYIIGTPQSRFSIYNDLDGFVTYKYPIFYPSYNYENLAEFLIKERENNPGLINTITEVERFTPQDIEQRREAYGNSLFQLQYMLSTELSDAERFPLQTKFLYLTDCDMDRANLVYEDAGEHMIGNYQHRIYRPVDRFSDFYDTAIMAVDPAGKGLDETAGVVMKTIGGRVFITDSYYTKDGYTEDTMRGIIECAIRNKVSTIVLERNYGSGMATELLIKYIRELGVEGLGCTDIISRGKKSRRIIETIEPFLTSGKLVADRKWFMKEVENPQYNMFQQAMSIDLDNIYSAKDDRIDALAIGLAYLKTQLAISEDQVEKEYKEKLFDHELESIIHSPSFVKYGVSKWTDEHTSNFGNTLNRGRRR